MHFSFPDTLSEVLARLTEKAKRFGALTLPAASVASIDHRLSIELTHGSTAIEGNTLTLRETQLLIDEGITPSTSKKLRELNEVTNHNEALQQIIAWVKASEVPSVEKALELHRIVLKNIEPETAGQFRDARVMVTGAPLQPVRPERIEDEMTEWVRRLAESSVHPVKMAIEAHYTFVKIHPFFDGNGRTARLLMNWILLSAGYPMTVISGEERARYISSIDDADLGNPEAFSSLICECVERSLDLYLDD